MKQEHWDELCRNIHDSKCIPFIGPEFPIEITQNGVNTHTTSSNLISKPIIDEITDLRIADSIDLLSEPEVEEKRLTIAKALSRLSLSELANEYLKRSRDNDTIKLNGKIVSHMRRFRDTVSSPYFKKLTGIGRFRLLIDTNFSPIFCNELQESYPTSHNGYYNFKGDLVANLPQFGTLEDPLIYNLYGSFKDTSSMAISEFDLMEWLSKVIAKDPPLPNDIKAELTGSNRCFLFLGFGFIAKSWHFRMLMYSLGMHQKSPTSFVLECLSQFNENDPAVIFFRDGLKTTVYKFEQKEFIDELCKRYGEFVTRFYPPDESSDEGKPKVFISYVSEDRERVIEIYNELKEKNINPWLDKRDLNGNWEENIAKHIKNSDAFLLLESQNMLGKRITYVNKEIHIALDQALRFPSSSNFIYRCHIDSPASKIRDIQKLTEIQQEPGITNADIGKVASNINRTYQRLIKARSLSTT